MRHPLSVLILLLGVACTSSTASEPLPPSSLKVTASNGTLLLENTSDRVAFYFTYERQAAALINWAQCVDVSGCTSVAPGAHVVVPYAAIGGYVSGSAEAIVWWWEAVQPGSGAAKPGILHNLVVRL